MSVHNDVSSDCKPDWHHMLFLHLFFLIILYAEGGMPVEIRGQFIGDDLPSVMQGWVSNSISHAWSPVALLGSHLTGSVIITAFVVLTVSPSGVSGWSLCLSGIASLILIYFCFLFLMCNYLFF